MKKSRTSLFRTLILFFVLLVTLFILVMAWFSSKTEANASGLTVKSSPGSGLEATFTPDDDTSWSYNIENKLPKAYPLVTGTGLFSGGKIDLFLPTVNKATGEVEKNSDGFWGVRSDAVAGKDFFETEVYFRSTEQLKVAITNESAVTPRSLIKDSKGNYKFDSNLSEFGNFSRDYIAGAARVGVYNADDELQFVWAPNKNYELKAGSEFVEIKKNSAAGGGSLSTNPEETFGINNYPHTSDDGQYYYMWEAKTPEGSNNLTAAESGRVNPQGVTMRYDSSTGNYLAALDVSSTTVVDHALFPIQVSQLYNTGAQPTGPLPSYPTSSYADANGNYYGEMVQISNFELDGKTYGVQLWFQYNKNITCPGASSSKDWAKMTINAYSSDGGTKEAFFAAMDRFQVLIGFDPTANEGRGKLSVKQFAFYSTTGSGIGGGTIGTGQEGSSAFALTNNQQVVFASPNDDPENKSTYALNASSTGITSNEVMLSATTVTETDSDSNTNTRDTYKISRESMLPGFVFTVEETGSVGQYKFKHDATGLYLYDNNGTLALTASTNATPFELTNGSDYTVTVTKGDGTTEEKTLTFCRLQSKGASGYYLSINESGAFLSTQMVDCRIFISQGEASTSSYTFNSAGTAQSEYQYLKKNTSSISSLTELTADVEAFPNPGTTIVTDLSNISNVPIITLSKENDTDQYYTGKIKLRIWVEGSDREAKTPLVNGIFYTQLVFVGTKVSA